MRIFSPRKGFRLSPALPREAMFDPGADQYLCQREAIIRYIETAQPANPLQVRLPLRILGLVSGPRDLLVLEVGEEKRRLTHAIDDLVQRQQVKLTWAPGGTWPSLQEILGSGTISSCDLPPALPDLRPAVRLAGPAAALQRC